MRGKKKKNLKKNGGFIGNFPLIPRKEKPITGKYKILKKKFKIRFP